MTDEAKHVPEEAENFSVSDVPDVPETPESPETQDNQEALQAYNMALQAKLEEVWGDDREAYRHAVDTQIVRIRTKYEDGEFVVMTNVREPKEGEDVPGEPIVEFWESAAAELGLFEPSDS